MSSNKFNIKEVTTIVMATLEEMSIGELFENYSEEVYLPRPIEDKVNKLSSDEREKFFAIILEISEEISYMKTGELNMLNMIHEEITFLAEERLRSYIIK